MKYMGIEIEIDSRLPNGAVMIICSPPKEKTFRDFGEILQWYIEHPEKIVYATHLK